MKGAKQGVDSQMTLLSKPGGGSEWHYGQNEKKMACRISNKSRVWHALFCFTPAVWLHLNKYKFALSLSHKHAGEITYCVGKQCLCSAQNFSRRPLINSSIPPMVSLWNHLSAKDGQVILPVPYRSWLLVWKPDHLSQHLYHFRPCLGYLRIVILSHVLEKVNMMQISYRVLGEELDVSS